MAKTPYNPFDVVKFANNASILTNNAHAKDYIGIVKEAGDLNSYIEWYDCKSKSSTREVTNLTGWRNNIETVLVGSLYHLITSKTVATTVMAPSVMTKTASNGTVEPEVRVKRKYTRKPGAAKPGPKPKKDKIAKPVAKKEVVEVDSPVTITAPVHVPTPLGKYGNPIDRDYFNSRRRYCFATGKFKHFKTRQMIDQSIMDCAHLYKHMNYNLDFVIVGEKPGPAKIEKLRYLGIPTISEEQWLAIIGARGFEFDPTVTNDARKGWPMPVGK